MEQEIPFKIFPLQRISSSHVSAVKPQAVVENTSFLQNLKSSHGIENKSYMASNSDCISLKVPPIAVIEEENPESINQLYSKLLREVETIKKWKSNVEFEIKEKETQIQEKRNIIDAQKKIIQDVQFENGKLRLQLEDVIQENEDLVKQSNGTRHLCNILKEACDRVAKKSIMLKQDNEKRQEMQKEQNIELAKCKKQILELTQDKEHKEQKILNLTYQLNESTDRIQALNEASDKYQAELEKHKKRVDEIVPQLEAANLVFHNTKNALKNCENELHTARTRLSEATKEKNLIVTELEETKSQHVLQLSVFQSKVENFEETLFTEQRRSEEKDVQLEAFKLEVMNTSSDLEELRKTNESHKKEIEQLQLELEQFHSIVNENINLKKLVGDLNDAQFQLQEHLKNKEVELKTLNIKINTSSVDVDRYSKQIEELKTKVNQQEEMYLNLKTSYENILTEKENLSRNIEEDMTNIQKDFKESKQQRDQAIKKLENLEKTNDHLRKENESLNEQLKAKDLECSTLHEDKKKHFEYEFSKKEKQQKTMENKLNTLKKQVENKNKIIEDLQQENKSLKKKMKEGCNHCSVLEAEVNELQVQIENARIQHEEVVNSKQVEITDAKTKGETLLKEVEKFKLSSEETIRMQRETDMKCQHKIAEMIALMEKHKHQYDKLLEEKDAELGGFRAKEQEIVAARVLMETELSNKNNEIVTLKMHLQQEKEQKKMKFKTSMQHKEVQTICIETPKPSTKIGDLHHSPSFSMKTPLKEKGKMSDNKNGFPWTSSKSCKSVVSKTFSMKTPPKYENVTHLHSSAKKKRKVSLEFDFHSDSSDPADILGICGNESMYHLSHSTPKTQTINPKKIHTEESLKSPGPALKTSTMKKMREAGWATIYKIERRRKMKVAEKIFS